MTPVKPPTKLFSAHLYLDYKSHNYSFLFDQKLCKITIIDIDDELNEKLVVPVTMFDGTEIKFSMISANLYMKINEKYELQEQHAFCDFVLYTIDEQLFFDGQICYLKNFDAPFSFIERFDAKIILSKNLELLDMWKKHEQIIMN